MSPPELLVKDTPETPYASGSQLVGCDPLDHISDIYITIHSSSKITVIK